MIANISLSIGLCFLLGLGGFFLSPRLGRVLGAFLRSLCLAGGFIWAHYNLSGLAPWPPQGSNESLFYVALLAPFLAVFYAPRIFWPILLSYLTSLMVLIPFVKTEGVSSQFVIVPLALSGLVWWRSIQKGLEQSPSLTLLIVSACFLSLGIHMILNGSALMGFLATACSSLAMAGAIVQWFLKESFADLQGFFALMYIGFISSAFYFLESPWYRLLWISLALIFVFPPRGPKFAKSKLWIGVGLVIWLSSLIPL